MYVSSLSLSSCRTPYPRTPSPPPQPYVVCHVMVGCDRMMGAGHFAFDRMLKRAVLFPGSTACTSCPAGYECPYTDSSYAVRCAPGYYSTGQQQACTPCSPGMYCPSPVSGTEIPCPLGTYSTGNQTSCTVCQPGLECPDVDTDLTV